MIECNPEILDRVYGRGQDTVVLCPRCGAIVHVDPWIRRRTADPGRALVSRIGTNFLVPAHAWR